MSKKKSSHRNKGLVFEELEPRLLLSADPLAVATDAGGSSVHELVVDNNEDQVAIVQTQVEQSVSPARNELVIIDSRAPNFQQLHNDLIEAQLQGRNVHVVILDAHRDGIEQINEALSSHNKLDALHIVSHGDDAQVQLGASQLNKTTLRDRSADIAQWRQAFSEGGDLLIYGCDLASSSEGRSMVHALGYLTATDVAASDDLTGNSLNGGDWELEYEAGDIETDVAFSEQVQDKWQGTLEGSAPAAQQEQAAEEQQQEQQAQAELLEQQTTRTQEDQETSREDEQQQQAAITQQQRQEVVFIDESVTDFQAFIDDLQNNSDGSTTFEIVLLNGDSSGIEQIDDALAAYNEVDALHILSHGDDGSVKLGNTWLNVSNINQHGENLSAWGDALDQDGDILIYGCNLAESAVGEQFVTELAQLTGADVAASNDNTGHALLNGDWELEYRHGAIETSVALSDDIQSSWTNVLANFTVDTSADTADDNPGDGLAQDASGNTSLRAAIEEANALGGANTITLAADTYTLSAGELLITSDITITGAGADQTFIDGNFLSRVLHTQGGATVTITDVTIQNGDASGGGNGGALWIDGATDNVTLERVKLINNRADTGGAIYNQGGTLTFTDGEISGNSAIGGGLNGGGLDNEGTAVLERVTISGNTASNGGGIYTGSAGSSLTMTNSTISGNNATMGGGISAYNTASLTNVTITLNNATNATGGSGIHRSGGSGSVQLRNTIVAGNTGTEDMLGTSYISLGNNLIGTPGNATDFTDGVNGDQVGTSASPIDPLLDPLSDNGGFAQTHALQAGSTAINNGTGTGAPATDQRGTLRDDGFIDIGAYEFASNTQALLWMTFENDEGGTANTDIPSISGGDVVTFSDITQLETSDSDPLAATTSGSFAYQFNLDTVLLSDGVTPASDGNTRVNALHYVNSDIQVGTNTVQLYSGDLLLSTDAAETIDGVTYEKEDVFVFRPDAAGDYSQGSFFRLIDGKNDTGWGNVTAVALAEQSAVVGDVTLNAGEFLVAHSGSDKNILRFTPGTLGDATTGTTTILVDGTDVDVGSSIGGLHLVQSDTVIGGVALSPGQILATLHGDDANLADNTINADRHDIVILDVTATGSGTSAATAARFFEGLDQSLDSNPETVWGLTLQETVNNNPVITSNGGGATASVNVAENTTAVTTVTATDVDLDTLSYSISGGADAALFSVDPNTGVLTFDSAPNFEAPADADTNNVYEVTVQASDGNGGTDTQAISVTVTEVLELVVTNTNSTGAGSLYEAIQNANANSGVTDTITFNIPGAGPHVINLTTALPAITDTVIIDGTTDPDYAGDPVIQIDGSALGAGVNGLTFTSTSDGSEVKGLMITNFTQHGIQVDSGTDGITISNNWIGTTGTGSVGDGNGDTGIYIQGANTVVGGTGLNDGNVITNNGNKGINITGAGATGTIIQGNIIGLDPDGATGSGNIDVGIALLSGAHNTTIGGSTAAARNIISNNVEGIEINSNNNTVQGNYIGTDVSGTLDRGNRSDDGVELQNGATGNLIGGSGAGEGNLIAFNARDGVYVFNGTGNAVLGNRIHSNTGLGIDLGVNGVNANDVNDVDAGANELQNFPVLSSALTNGINTIAIEGSLNSTANTDFRIEFFASTVADTSGYGEAERYLGSVNISTDAGGNAAFSVNLTDVVAAGEFITATATIDLGGSNYGSTSEFAQSVPAVLSNFAPTLDNTGIMALTSIKENEVNSNGDLVSDIIASAGGNRITDPDVGAVEGMAVIAVDDTNGTWEYSSDGGSNWTAFGAVTNNSAVVLTGTGNDRIRFVPNAGFSGVATFTFHAWDTTDALASGTTGVDASIIGGSTAFSAATEEVRVEVLPTEIRILFTTQSDINNSGVPGIKSWTTGDVLAIGDPNLSFEPLGSDGSVYRYLDLGVLTADNDMQMQGLHYVSRDVTVGGANSVDLQRGDILFVSQNAETMTSTNSLSFAAGDVIAFRPDTPDDYTSGTFIHVIDKPGTQQTTGISLVEQDILVGDTTLLAGTFLFTQADSGLGEGNNIYHFSADDAGAGTTTGTVSTLITGTDIDIAFNEFIGVMLVTEDMSLNGTTVAAGSIITSLANGDVTTGDNTIATNEDEIIYLTASTTSFIGGGGSGTTTADATVLFDGGDIGLNNNQKKMRSLGFIEIVGTLNVDPVISLPGGGINFTEGDPPSVIDASATLIDPDSADFDGGVLRVDITGNGTSNDRLAVRHEGTAAGQVGVSGNNVTYGGTVIGAFSGGTTGTDPLFVNFNTSADVAAVQAVMRNITFENTSATPSTSQRTVEFTVTDGDLGNSGAVSTTVDVTDVVTANAPVATDDPGGYSATVSSYNPLSYWRFGETSGTSTSDNGSTSNSGTFNGVTLGQAGAINGDTDTAISFDGTDDYVVMPHDDAYLIDDGTIQLWFNADDLSSDQGLISKDSSGFDTGGHFTIRVLTDGSIEVRLQSDVDSNFMSSGAGTVTAGSWHHVAVTFGASGMELFLDGVSVDTNPYTGGMGTTSGDIGNYEPIAIGASTRVSGNGTVTPLQDFFAGSIDEVAIMDQALTAEQIQDIYASALQNYTIAEDTSLVVSAAEGVLSNDSDADGDPLTAVLDTGPSNAAAFNLNADGSFSYTPVANFSGTDTFTYMANDGSGNSNVATVTITITGDNDAPVNTVPVSATVLEDTQTAIAGLSVADPDAGAGVITTQLTVTNGVLDVTLAGTATISVGANGSSTLTISGNVTDINATLASLQYTGNANINGVAADTLTMVTNDLGNTGTGGALSDTSNVQIDITAVNDAPVARDDRIGLVFDGIDDYVTIGDYAGLNVTTNVTMEAWIKPTGLGTGTQIIVNKEGEYEMAITAETGEVKWAFDNVDPDWSWHNTGYFVQPGEWTHLAVTYNNGVVNTYANGVLVDTYNGSGAIADEYSGFNQLQIGGRENAVDQRFDGQIDEVRIWNTTRSQLDIQNNMNTLLTGAEAGLIGNWRFDEGSGITVEDQSVFGHHGTLADGITAGEMPAWQGYVVSEDGILTVTALNGVLPNDYDIDGDSLTAVLDTGPANAAAFTLNPDGSFTYTPAADFNGIDSFTYHANDGTVDSNIATVTIRVYPVNDAPQATNLNAAETYIEDTALNLTDIVVSDVDSANVTVTLILSDPAAGSLNTATSGSVTSTFVGGTWTASGAIANVNTLLAGLTFTPSLNYNSNFSIATSVDDGVAPAITGSKAITGTPVNDAPQATNLNAAETYTEDTALNLTDIVVSDVDSANVTVTLILSDPAAGSLNTATSGSVTSTFVGDTWTASGDIGDVNTLLAGLAFTPSLNYNSNFSIATSVDDGIAPVITGSKAMTGTPVNDVPVANANTVTTTEDNAYNFTAADFTFSDVESDSLVSARITNLLLGGGTLTYGGGTAVISDNTLTAAQLNTLVYTPPVSANGSPLATFDFTVNDADLGVVTAQMSINVTAVNNAPTATNLSAAETYTEDTALNLTDIVVSDVDSASVTVTLILSDPAAGSLNTATSGSVTSTFVGDTWTASGAIDDVNTLLAGLTFTPSLNYNSNFNIATSVSDGVAPAITGTKVMTGTPVNDVPVATANTVTTNEDTAFNFAATDFTFTDVEGDSLISATITGLNLNGGTLVHSGSTAVTNGMTLTAAELDTLVYTPALNANGSPLATFDFTVNDSGMGVTGAQMSINVTAQPDPAVIGGVDTGVVTEDLDPDMDNQLEVSGSLTILDPDAGEQMFVTGPVGGTYGVITMGAAGNWDYAANTNQAAIQGLAAGATLLDTITVSSVDGTTHDINITIMGTNDAPVAGNDVANVNEGGAVIIDVAATDSDIDDALDLNSIIITGLPTNGNVVVNGGGTVTYTHDGSETLLDSFTYTISDISGAVSNSATVTVNINPVNDPPAAGNDTATVAEGNAVLIDLAANDSDVDNALDLNSINIIGAPANGALVVNVDGTVTYTHDGSNTVSDSFTYTISDISGAISNPATVNITITAVNNAPTTTGIAGVTVSEDAANTDIDLNAAFDDSDNLDSELTYSIVGNNNIGLFTATGIDGATGRLTLDYAADMNGSAQISVRATDPAGLSVDTLFTVTVTPVNDAPVVQANTGMLAGGTAQNVLTSSELNVTDIDNTSAEITYTVTALPANGALLLNGTVMAVNDTFTQADLDNNLLAYQPAGTASADQFGFTVADSSGAALTNNTFDILVQVVANNDDGDTDNDVPPDNGDTDEEPEPEDSSEAGDDGLPGDAGEYGGGYVPIGSTSAPQVPPPALSIDPVPEKPSQERVIEKEERVAEAEVHNVETFAAVQVKSMDALWGAIDKMKQEMGGSSGDKMSHAEFKVAAAKSSGVVLTAGVVAWILRSGALLSSLMSTIPLWKGYDPLPILAYKDDEEKKEEDEIHEDKIPTSLEELQKLKKLKEKKSREVDVDSIFGGSAIRE